MLNMDSIEFTSGMAPFFSLGASTKWERIAMLKKAFIFVAGDNLNDFIKHFLTATKFGRNYFLPAAQSTKSDDFLENLKELILSSPSKHLPALRSLVTSNYSLKELNNLGFDMTKNEYTYSKKIKNIKKSYIKYS